MLKTIRSEVDSWKEAAKKISATEICLTVVVLLSFALVGQLAGIAKTHHESEARACEPLR